ncbi:hypothetical protein MNB_SV-5-1287 [hydrothermal vent metagenome]|uniref:Uncharacterized protein n=1 Tax=hydrothermal vent metagenome TaxID=652676 RepID=A0A1W1EEJ7_9ZZZZ
MSLKKTLLYFFLFYIYTPILFAKTYTNTSYYVAYDNTDKTNFALVMPAVQKIYTHKAGHLLSKDLTQIDTQFTTFPTYDNGKLCFSSLKKNSSGENGASLMANKCYDIYFFYTQKDKIPNKGASFILTYTPNNTIYEGIAGDANSFKRVKEENLIQNENSPTGEDYTQFQFNIYRSEVIFEDSNYQEFDTTAYKGLYFYHKNIGSTSYQLKQLDDNSFNALNKEQKYQVADKLLSTFFFGYPLNILNKKIKTGTFISMLQEEITEEKTDIAWVEDEILDNTKFHQHDYNEQVAVDILTRFYVMKKLDSYFIKNWVAYILTQTIMFSPAYELDSTHTPNIASVYNRIVRMLAVDSGMRYISYVHMSSEDNWRRFRSPEDNGREMLEIFTLDNDDTHVPIAGQALKNWKLDRDHDTLLISLNQNREALQLFNTTIYTGDDFYRELAKSSMFTNGVTYRLVAFFFPNESKEKKYQITNSIVSSKPETWQDILLQIVFSEAYLLDSHRAKSAEELFYSLAKKTQFQHRTDTFHELKNALEEMHQASMKYKLGKRTRVPLDTLSFATYHKYIRERIFLRKSNPNKTTDYEAWDRQGWNESFLSNDNFTLDKRNSESSLTSIIQYLFTSIIARSANNEEISLFKKHMLHDKSDSNQTKVFRYTFDIFRTYDDPEKEHQRQESRKKNIAIIVLDYISRLTETYTLNKVK